MELAVKELSILLHSHFSQAPNQQPRSYYISRSRKNNIFKITIKLPKLSTNFTGSVRLPRFIFLVVGLPNAPYGLPKKILWSE